MYWEDGNLRISPSDLIVFLESEFASWMDRWLLDGNTSGPVFDSVRTENGWERLSDYRPGEGYQMGSGCEWFGERNTIRCLCLRGRLREGPD